MSPISNVADTFVYRKPLNDANSEDPDVMPQSATLQQGMYCLLRLTSGTEVHLSLGILTRDPLLFTMNHPW